MNHIHQITLDTGWKFHLGDLEGAQEAFCDESVFSDVSLPHDWQIKAQRDPDMDMGWSQGYYPRNQIGWYRLHLAGQAGWKGKTLRLLVEGCQRFYEIYLNGHSVGGHRYGYVPSLFDVTDSLLYDNENVISIRVNNADTLGDRWYSGAGLNRASVYWWMIPCT